MANFRTAYGERKKVVLEFKDENGEPLRSLTKQSEKDRCDINKIMSRYDKTGLITHVASGRQFYGDFTQINEYQQNLDMVIAAQNAFAEMPSEIRKRFGNDPGEFFEFVTNPKNEDELVKLGLANPKPVPDVIPEPDKASKPAESAE